MIRPLDEGQQLDPNGFGPEEPSLALLTRLLDGAKLRNWVNENGTAVVVLWDPDFEIAIDCDFQLRFTVDFRVPYWLSPVNSQPIDFLHTIGMNGSGSDTTVEYVEKPEGHFRFTYVARLEGGPARHNLVHHIWMFTETAYEALEPLVELGEEMDEDTSHWRREDT